MKISLDVILKCNPCLRTRAKANATFQAKLLANLINVKASVSVLDKEMTLHYQTKGIAGLKDILLD